MLAPLLAVLAAAAPQTEPISVRDVRDELLSAGGRRFALRTERAGVFVASVESYDFAVRLAAVAPDGTMVDEREDERRPARVWVELTAGADEALELVVTSTEREDGRFTLSLFERGADADRAFDAARAAVDAEHHREALGLLDEALVLVLGIEEEKRDRRLEGNIRIWQGNALLVLGRVDESLEAQASAGELFRLLGDMRKELVVVGNIGNVQVRHGRLRDALRTQERALELAQATDDPEAEAGAHNNLAAALRGLDRRAEACERFARARDLYRTLGDAEGEALTTINIGQTLLDLRDYDEARRELEAGKRAAIALGRNELEIWARTSLGTILLARGALAQAEAELEDACALAERIGDANAWQWALAQLALTRAHRADLPGAREAWTARLALNEQLDNAYIEAWSRWGLGGVAVLVGDLIEAEKNLRAAHEFARSAGDAYLEAICEADLARLLIAQGDYSGATEHAAAAVALQGRRGDRLEEADALVVLADAQIGQGEDERAARSLDRAEELYVDLGLEPGALAVLRRRSVLQRNAGDLGGAREGLRDVLERARAVGDRYLEVLVALDLAQLEHDCGAFPLSRTLALHAYDVARATGAVGAQVDSLRRICDASFHLGDYEGAEQAARRRADLAHGLGRHGLEARARLDVAVALMNRGEDESAYRELEGALVLASEGSLDTRARILGRLGRIELSRGERSGIERMEERVRLVTGLSFAEAQARASLAIARYDRLGDQEGARLEAAEAVLLFDALGDRSWSVAPYRVLASIALDEGDAEPAAEGLRRATELLGGPAVQHLESENAATLRSQFADWGRIAQDLAALRMRSAADAAGHAEAVLAGLRAAGRWKGRVLLEGIAEHRAGGRTAEAIAIRRRWSEALALREDVLDAMAAAHQAGAEREEIERLAKEERRHAALAQSFEVQLAEESARDIALDQPAETDVARVQAELLDGRTALVEMVEGRRTLAAYAVTVDDVQRVELASREEVQALVGAVLEAIASHERRAPASEVIAACRAAARTLFDPVMRALEGRSIERLVIVPCESVARLPFEALVLDASDEARGFADVTFVLDRYQVGYAPATPVLLELIDQGPRVEQGRVLILADPTYPLEGPRRAQPPSADTPALAAILGGAVVTRAAPSPGALPRLIETRREAVALARLLARHEDDPGLADDLLRFDTRRSGSVRSGLFDLHLGEAAGPDKLRGDLREFAIVHVAAHGFVDPLTPQRSGLALAFTAEDAGWFAIEDALQLDLDANLVVLSACETASGTILAGEGVQSLARAFLYAGARGVVASLWPVADESTARTMEAFYAGLLEQGLSPAAALTEARRAARRSSIRAADPRGVPLGQPGASASDDTGHPYFWAPFVHIGLPR